MAGLWLGVGVMGWAAETGAPGPGAAGAWETVAGGRVRALEVPAGAAPAGGAGFQLLGPERTGVAFTNTLDEGRAAANRVLLNGSGLALGDVDGDGRPDVFLAGLQGGNALYRNLGGWKFEDITARSGLKRDARTYRGAVLVDVNGDASLDLVLAVQGEGVEVWLNDGTGRFSDGTTAARTAGPGAPLAATTFALADVDGNGTLDLYVANNRPDDIRDRGQVNLRRVNGAIVVPPEWRDRLVVMNGQVLEYGLPDQLYLNDGRGRFAPVSWTGGRFRDEAGQPLTGPPLDWGLAAMFRDLNGDGAPDLYVCNDFWTPDRIWWNDGKGRFRAVPPLTFRRTSASSMGVDVADVDRDGRDDIFVVDMLSRDPRLRLRQALAQAPMTGAIGAIEDRPQSMRNTLFHQRADGTYAEVANVAGVAASDWSWSPVFLDVDLDGYEDLLVAGGHARDVQDLDAQAVIRSRQRDWKGFASEADRQRAFTAELMEHMRLYPSLALPVAAFRNRGDGRFEDVTARWGTDSPGVHQALATADLDGDGDLDLVINNLGAGAGFYRNDSVAPRVAVRLKGLPPNTQGIGARVSLLGGPVPRQSQEIIAGGRYLAGGDAQLGFAAGPALGGGKGGAGRTMALEVTWRSGRRSRIEPVQPGRLYEIDERQAVPGAGPGSGPGAGAGAAGAFVDESSRLAHRHVEPVFDDFARQPLLPWKLSQGGPGVAWFDLDGDGVDELFVGTGRGGLPGAWRVGTNGTFAPLPVRMGMDGAGLAGVPDDTAGLVGWTSASGRRSLLTAVTGYEVSGAPALLTWRWTNGAVVAGPGPVLTGPAVAGGGVGAGVLAAGDLDGDGDLDLLVGGAVVPGRYPEAGPSRIFRSRGEDVLELDAGNTRVLADVGLVNGAVWSDLDADGLPELILACEWGPVRVYRNEAGQLRDATAELGLERHTGWWKGVATGDFDGDGRLDLVVANWGWNGEEQAEMGAPLRMYHGDFSGRGVVDLFETQVDAATGVERPRRGLDVLAQAIPSLREEFPTVRAFSEAEAARVLGARRGEAKELSVRTLASTVFLRRGARFEPRPLPLEAQWAPAAGVAVADMDGDGFQDVFLGQNFFATRPETPRLDAGLGLWLRGDGAGGFGAVDAAESGVRVAGEQRGVALADYDGDGRMDLVVTQNGAATRLWRNRAARPGLRVRLRGPVGNPEGWGAVVRLRAGGAWGPACEVRGASGYLSQGSAVAVLSAPPGRAAEEIEVRWPGGRMTRLPVPAGATELSVGVGP